MRFYWIFGLLLLVALVSAGQGPYKLLFDNDYILSESFDATMVKFTYPVDGYPFYIFRIKFENQNDSKVSSQYVMFKQEEFEMQDVSFAMESVGESSEADQQSCKQTAAEKLRPLIDRCGNVVLRELTEEEKKQMQKFKEQQQKTKALAKVVYDKKSIRTQSVGLRYFDLTSFPKTDTHQFVVYTVDFSEKTQSMWFFNSRIPRSTFVVERLPAGSVADCYDSDPSYLRPDTCNGDMRLRRKTDDD